MGELIKHEAVNTGLDLKRIEGGVYLLTFVGNAQHRFTPRVIRAIDDILNQVANDAGASALVTINQGKFFSNGMDITYLRSCDLEGAKKYLHMFHKLVSKILTFSVPSIAIIRGHAVGAGCIFALAHDYRIMNSRRGYIFMNEVELGLPLTPGNVAVLRAKLPTETFQEVILTGKRYGGANAYRAGIVHDTEDKEEILLESGIKKAMEYKARNWNKEVYHLLKMEMFKDTIRELEIGGVGFARL
ncbi:hypothetical protein ACHQM5_004845 [Ranunculus cassubicifolius]